MIKGGRKLESEILRSSLKIIKRGTEISFVDSSWFLKEREKNILRIVSENVVEQIGEGPYEILEISDFGKDYGILLDIGGKNGIYEAINSNYFC